MKFRTVQLAALSLMLVITPAFAQTYTDDFYVVETEAVTIIANKQVGKLDITELDIDRINPNSLADLFRETPAIMVQGGSYANQKMYIHGLDQNNINVTVDGASVGAYGWHHASYADIDVNFLKAVSVDVGVAPADSGFGSAAGAIRFETKDAKDLLLPGKAIGGMLNVRYGFENEDFRTTASGYTSYEGFDILAMYTGHFSNDWKSGAGKKQNGTGDELNRGLFKLAYEFDEGSRFAFSSEYSHDGADRQFKSNMTDNRNPNYSALVKTETERTTVNFQYTDSKPTPVWDPEIQFYYNNMHQLWGNTADMYYDKFGGKAQNRFTIPWGNVVVGADFSNFDLKRKPTAADPYDATETSFQGGLYAQARLNPFNYERLSLSFGIRGDYQRFDAVDNQRFRNGGLSPNVSAEFAVFDWLAVFGGYSHVWSGLSSVEHALLTTLNSSTPTHYTNVEPTTADNFRVGLRLANDYFTFEPSFFYTKIHNPMAYNQNSNPRTRFSGEDLQSTGVDISLKARYEGFSGGINYTYANVKYGKDKAGSSNFYLASQVGHLVSGYADYYIAPWQVTVGASAELGFKIDEPDFYMNDYQVVNTYVRWEPEFLDPNLSIRFDVTNLFDENYYRRGTYSGSVTNDLLQPVYNQGRNFILSATLRF